MQATADCRAAGSNTSRDVANKLVESERSTNRLGDMLPTSEPGIVQREVKDNSTGGSLNPNSQLHQPLTQCGDLRRSKFSPCSPASNFLHENIGGSSHQNTELVGQKLVAARPINLQAVMQFLDPIFHVSSLSVDLVDISGSMTGEKISAMAICTTMIAYGLRNDELAISFFESDTHVLKNLKQKKDIEELADELLSVKARGGTRILSALEWARKQFKEAGSRERLNILFTDAEIYDLKDAVEQLRIFRSMDINFILVCPEASFNLKEAKKMAPETFMTEAAAMTDSANVKLVAMENQSFNLIQAGNAEAALR